MKLSAKEILEKAKRLFARDSNWRSLWQQAADFISPKRSNILSPVAPGIKQTEKLFDSTGIHSNELLGASMKQAITPANVKWFSIRHRDEELMKDEDVVRWLEDSAKRMFLAFHQSNFDSEVHELDLDLGAFGMGAMYCDEKPRTSPKFNGLRFHTLSIGEYTIEENFEGDVDTLLRTFRPTARVAFSRWGKDVGPRILKALEQKPEQTFPFIHCVTPGERFFVSHYLNVEEKLLVEKPRLYRGFPYLVPRWGKTSGEENGRGPGFIALPDIRTLNKAVQLELQALAMMIKPPMKSSDNGVIGSPKLIPGGLTIVQRNAIFEPLKLNIELQTYQVRAEKLEAKIRRVFYSDQLQMQDTPTMTAAEAYIRYELMQRILGPTLGRMEREFLDKLIKRAFSIMYFAGAFSPMPPILQGRLDELDIEYEGEMAKAQKSSEVSGLMDVLNILAIVAPQDPSVIDWLNFDAIIPWLWEIRGVPKKLLNLEDDVKGLRANRAKNQDQSAQEQRALLIAEVLKKLAPAIREGAVPSNFAQIMAGAAAGGQL
jgi:hypothetical protein